MFAALKPKQETIVINGDTYRKVSDKEYLFVSIYRCEHKNKEIKIEYSERFKQYILHTLDIRFVDSIDNMTMQENQLDPWWNDAAEKALDKIITETLLKNEKK